MAGGSLVPRVSRPARVTAGRPRPAARRAVAAVAAAAASLLTASAAASPQPALSEPGWIARFDFSLEVDGKPAPDARFFQERDGRRVLIQVPGAAKLALLSQAAKEVRAIDAAKVSVMPGDDAARMAPGAEAGAPITSYTVDTQGGEVVFYLGRQRLKILPKAPIVGPTTVEAILRHTPVYRRERDGYVPDPREIAFLRSVTERVDVQVFFGTWCPHCKVFVPKFMKTLQAAANSNVTASYVGVPQPFHGYEPARLKRVTGIPTFIFTRGGEEIGRIPGEPADGSTIEKAMADVFRQSGR